MSIAYRKTNRPYTEKDLPQEGEYKRLGIGLNREDMEMVMRIQKRRQKANGRVPGMTLMVREGLELLDRKDQEQ